MKSKQNLRIKYIRSIYMKMTLDCRCWLLAATLLILMLCSSVCTASTCPSSIPKTTATTIDYYSNIQQSIDHISKGVSSPVSDNLYYLRYIMDSSFPYPHVLMKLNLSGTKFWLNSFEIDSLRNSLSIDVKELNIYLAGNYNPVIVLRLDSSNGAIISQHKYDSSLYSSGNTKIWPLSDNSAYYISLHDGSSTAKVCKYSFLSSSAQCQSISNILNQYSSLMFSDTQLFLLGPDPSNILHMYKARFSSASVEWANMITCNSCSYSYSSESLLNVDNSKIYSFFYYGPNSNSQIVYFATLTISTGNVASTTYKSSDFVNIYNAVYTLNSDYIIASNINYGSSYMLLIYNIASSSFICKIMSKTSSALLFESLTDRLIISGSDGGNLYISKFMIQSIDFHSFFSESLFTMDPVNDSSFSITSQSGELTSSQTLVSDSAIRYVIQQIEYVHSLTYTSDVYYNEEEYSISILESSTKTFSFNLSCSFSGKTNMTYLLGPPILSWISLDLYSGELTVNAKNVESDEVYDIKILTTYTGIPRTLVNSIKLKVVNSISNDLGTSILCIIILTFFVVAVIKCWMSTSMMSCWAMITQMQMLFLLLTRCLTSDEVRALIRNSKFAMNIYNYISLFNNGSFDSLFPESSLEITDTFMKDTGLRSDSSIYNTYSIIICLFCIFLFQLVLHFLYQYLQKLKVNDEWRDPFQDIKWRITKINNAISSLFYMRNSLLLCQFILISSFYDITTFSFTGIYRICSLLFSFFLLILYIGLIVVIIYCVFSKKAINSKYYDIISPLFSDLKELKKHKFHQAVFLIRRFVYVILLVVVKSFSSRSVVLIISFIQVPYVIYMIIIRPYKEGLVNFIEISNEIFFCILVIILNFLYQESQWNSVNTGVYMALIELNICFILIVILINLGINIAKKKMKSTKRENNYIENPEEIRHEEYKYDHPIETQNRKEDNKIQLSVRNHNNSKLMEEHKGNFLNSFT